MANLACHDIAVASLFILSIEYYLKIRAVPEGGVLVRLTVPSP